MKSLLVQHFPGFTVVFPVPFFPVQFVPIPLFPVPFFPIPFFPFSFFPISFFTVQLSPVQFVLIHSFLLQLSCFILYSSNSSCSIRSCFIHSSISFNSLQVFLDSPPVSFILLLFPGFHQFFPELHLLFPGSLPVF